MTLIAEDFQALDKLRPIDHLSILETFFARIPKLTKITAAALESCTEAEPLLFQDGIITTPNKPTSGSVSKRKLDPKNNTWEDNHSDAWLDLVRYIREMFSTQNIRRFILDFTLCGSIVQQVCLEDFIKQQSSKGSVADAPDQAVVIKDSWKYEERPEEGLLLKEAIEAGVQNVACGDMDDVLLHVRKGLSDTVGRNPLQHSPGTGRGRSRSRATGRKRSSSNIYASTPLLKWSC
ncbi:hypothetical protein GQ44DRAFT_737107 [Phaeosphaeriaceae sp. PMI808]|nr:hypothetical protein GQ44DRAFT_737107 [Phaeosphaeriaceae sp. PMI808]